MTLPKDASERKQLPITTGALDYFPDAIAEVARCSKVGNDQHNPGEPLHWAREKSADQADCIVRHLVERGTFDTDGVRHSAKVAWRALALLQLEIEAAEVASEELEAWAGPVEAIGTPDEEYYKTRPNRRQRINFEGVDPDYDAFGNPRTVTT